MSSATLSTLAPVLPRRLRDRLEDLGATIVLLDAEGRSVVMHPSSGLDRLVAQSPVFRAAIRIAWPQLHRHEQRTLELWPGVFLQPLRMERRRHTGDPDRNGKLFAVLLLSREVEQCEQIRGVCDAAGVDYEATMAEADARRLPSGEELGRVSAMLAWMQDDAMEVERRSNEVHSLSQQLLESYEELSLLYKFSTGMTVDRAPAAFLSETCRELQQVADFSWMAMHLVDDEPTLGALSGGVFTAGSFACDEQTLRQIAGTLVEMRADERDPLVVEDTTSLPVPHLPALTESLLVVSMRRDDKLLGILFAGDKGDGSHISSIDAKLCNSLASSATMFLENMMLYEDAQDMFMGVLHALTASIDAKDSYTHGHSERVAMMAKKLAAAYGLQPRQIERVHLSGLVHDVGKIGVPESVLMKPGSLTPDEFDLIKKHPETGARILQDIRQMSDLIPGVLYHHERWDGQGYPFGLAGNDIPLFGRLIGLADAFDAMTSNRAYRARRELDEVLLEIKRCAGTQFDPELADLFVLLDFSDFERVCRQHHERESQR